MLNRREVLKVSALSIVSSCIYGMTTARGADAQDHLVIQIDSTEIMLSQHQAKNLRESLKEQGLGEVTLLCLPRGSTIGVIGKPSTFRHFKQHHVTRVWSNGIELDRVRWADSASGLVCQLEAPSPLCPNKINGNREIVSRYPNVTFTEG